MNGFRGGARLFRAISAEVWLVQQRKGARGPLDRSLQERKKWNRRDGPKGTGSP